MTFQLYIKGRKVSPELLIGALDPDETGVFESLRTYGGRIFREEEHLVRLVESARTIDLRLPRPIREIRSELRAALRAYLLDCRKAGEMIEGDLFIRLSVWREHIFVMVGQKKHSDHLYSEGIVLMTTCVRRSLTNAGAPQAKTGAYQNGVLAALEPAPEAYEHLFLDPEGYVAEVSVGNLFLVKKQGPRSALLTPPARGILNGVTRRFVIECAAQQGYKVLEEPLMRHDVYNADEAFLTNTSWEILPVREVDRRRIGKTVPGPETLKIHRIFRERAVRECRKSKSAAR